MKRFLVIIILALSFNGETWAVNHNVVAIEGYEFVISGCLSIDQHICLGT